MIRADILEEAAGWLIEFRAGEPDSLQRREFDGWLRTSPEHVRAYLELCPLWNVAARLDATRQPDEAALISLAQSADSNVLKLAPQRLYSRAKASKTIHWNRAALGLAAAVLVTVFTVLYVNQLDTYSTETGEQRSLTLPDGSIVELNALSRVRIRFGPNERRFDLLEGQALFRVAREVGRPFIVHSSDTQIRAVGTEFDVYKRPGGRTTVTVLDGRVNVTDQSLDTGPVSVSAGQQVSLTHEVVTPPAPANVQAATAWTQHRLIFSATPLEEVAEEFNRYNRRRLIVEEPDLQAFQINGVFSSANPTALLGFLREQPGIAVSESPDEIRIVRR